MNSLLHWPNDLPSEKITDSQLILAAYEKWGEHCPEQLLGDFAFHLEWAAAGALLRPRSL